MEKQETDVQNFLRKTYFSSIDWISNAIKSILSREKFNFDDLSRFSKTPKNLPWDYPFSKYLKFSEKLLFFLP